MTAAPILGQEADLKEAQAPTPSKGAMLVATRKESFGRDAVKDVKVGKRDFSLGKATSQKGWFEDS